MNKHHSEDYKLAVIKYFKENNDTVRNTCVLFGCSHTSLIRWNKQFLSDGNIKRKERDNKNLKVIPQIEKYILEK